MCACVCVRTCGTPPHRAFYTSSPLSGPQSTVTWFSVVCHRCSVSMTMTTATKYLWNLWIFVHTYSSFKTSFTCAASWNHGSRHLIWPLFPPDSLFIHCFGRTFERPVSWIPLTKSPLRLSNEVIATSMCFFVSFSTLIGISFSDL